ncbi:transglutaminase TgpA family protein [Luteimicrobium subarcticum]|uniref:Transglutaminase-like putative cysteine protease n=1 Tax=Luteimicrobium subarcticum TaxID=620910 RepID=A0A2M8WTX3_9MICO|nr:transglutaminaseTgpA domain-containing protein [Luteimicrobium subarcticum]PJI94349.1 transglutaminase-like putative cysteine protease [Luteimicrobium subarcticum]
MTPAARLRDVAALAVVTSAVSLSLYGLTTVVWNGAWIARLTAGLVLVALSVGIARWFSAGRTDPRVPDPARWVPTLVGAVVGVVVWFALGTAGDAEAAVLRPSVVGRTLGSATELYHLAQTSVPPIEATAPVTTVTLGAGILTLLVADALAIPLRRPVAAAVVTVTLSLPALVIAGHVPLPTLLGWCATPLLLLAVDRAAPAPGAGRRTAAPAGVRRSLSATASTAAVTVVVVVAAVAVGSAAGFVRDGSDSPLKGLFGGTSSTGRLGNDLNVLQDLGERPETVVMSLTTRGSLDGVGPMRLYTLTSFDGSSWVPERDDATSLPALDDTQAVGAQPGGRSAGQQVVVSPHLLPHQRLATTTEPSTVRSTDGTLRYDADRDELYRTAAQDETSPYALVVRPRSLDADTLAQDALGVPDDVPDVIRAALEVPDTSHRDDVTALARQLTQGATNDYERAVVLQDYLRGSDFTYTTKAPPPKTGDAVWDFLQARTGYCVQFATSMTMMLRDLGIPARVGVGYLVHPTADGTSADVRGVDAHAWPEVWFEGAGWVRFEPTPAVQSGAPPQWATVSSAAVAPRPEDIPPPRATTTSTSTATSQATSHAEAPAHAGAAAAQSSRTHRWVAPLVGLVLLAAVGTAVWLLRRRAARTPPADPEAAWATTVRRLEALGVHWPSSTTPRRAAGEVEDAVFVLSGHRLDPDASAALRTLTGLVEQARYARVVPDVDAATLADLVDRVAAGAQSTVSGRRRSDAAPSAPRAGS